MKKKIPIKLLIIFFICLILLINLVLSKEVPDSMQITMIGGSTMAEYGGVISCSYIIKTKNNDLIVVDGGIDADKQFLEEYINLYGGKVSHWYITHPHRDHVGALIKILEDNKCKIRIENLYYSFNSLEWYEQYDKRGFETEQRMLNALKSNKIKNKISCEKNQIIYMDNVKCEILKVATPEITYSDNGNDSGMVFKMTATDVDESIIFLGDAYTYSSIELLENPESLKADVVQMAHHGQNGVSKEVYEAISPRMCCYNAPAWLYNNDTGAGYNTGPWKSVEVQEWMREIGAFNIVSFDGNTTIRFTKKGIEL